MHDRRGKKVLLCVAAYNAGPVLKKCLPSLLAQSPDAVLVVDDGSSDDTASVAESFEGVEVIRLETNRGVAAARNAALERIAGYDYVGFIDSDIELAPGWLDALLSETDWDTYSAACGRVAPADAGKHWAATLDEIETGWRFGREARELDPPWREVMYFNYLFKREALEQVGKFDPRFRTNAEDSDYFYRCAKEGLRFRYVPVAKALHRYPRPTLWGWLKRSYRNGFYTIQFHRKHRTPLLKTKRYNLVGAYLGMGSGLLVSFWNGPVWIAACVGVIAVAGFPAELGRLGGFHPGLALASWWRRLAKMLGEIRGVFERI